MLRSQAEGTVNQDLKEEGQQGICWRAQGLPARLSHSQGGEARAVVSTKGMAVTFMFQGQCDWVR